MLLFIFKWGNIFRTLSPAWQNPIQHTGRQPFLFTFIHYADPLPSTLIIERLNKRNQVRNANFLINSAHSLNKSRDTNVNFLDSVA